ncbi:phosphoethanolamine transferase [Rugamonas sp.]|uniref:phosphoethanolamine transferase n=1 Tax=Rugamonas sp. TaxID=1926287 RepID=UPI0025FA4B49|nr:phosphoethanolamine transferase [Rugamonas sp.]
MRKNLSKALLLAGWLWLPSLAVLSTDNVQGGAEIFALLAFSLLLLAAPLVLVPRLRNYFLLWTPLALLVAPYCYMTVVYGSVPGEVLLSAALHTSLALSLQVLGSFGWRVWLVPASLLLYVLLALSLDRAWKLSLAARKRLLAGLLLYVMLAMVARQALDQRVALPPLLEQSTLDLAFPSGLALSLSRLYRHPEPSATFVSVHGRAAASEPLLVVLVVGESLRSDHLGINGYGRNTTPHLAALGPELLSFPDVASSANWTNHAVPGIVTLPLESQRANLTQTFHEAGFRSAWISNQEPSPYGSVADVVEYAIDSQDYHLRNDASLLPLFTSFVRQAGLRQFVVLHMMGSHIPYEERYSASSKVFIPTLRDLGVDEPVLADKAAAINSYDNTVIETDKFLARVIEVLRKEQRPAVMLYTSDHGENLFDNERHLFMHTQPGPTRYDTHVPLLVWMNPPYRAAHPGLEQVLRANSTKKVSHADVFPSLLGLGAVQWDDLGERRSFAAPGYMEHPRVVMKDLSSTTLYDDLK